MKRSILTAMTLAALAAMPLTFDASAQDGDGASTPSFRGPHQRRGQAAQTTDGTTAEDGTRQRGHRKIRDEEFRAELLEKYDANKDGQLDETERAAAKEEIQAHRTERREKFLAEFDTNGDGQLDETERSAAKEARQAKMTERLDTMLANPPERLLQKFDTDKSGDLSDEEKAAAKEAIQARMQQRHQRGEGDGDGPRRKRQRRGADAEQAI